MEILGAAVGLAPLDGQDEQGSVSHEGGQLVRDFEIMLPHWENSQVVLPVEHGTGNWIGAASALTHGDYIYLAYRDRH
ncbi:MAG TPA: hypothetical protein VF940_04030, partial [Streptosporangiaceae bacterium]